MRALIQRVTHAKVSVEGTLVGSICEGMVVFVCAMRGDSSEKVSTFARKIANLRIFRDDAGKMNRSLLSVQGSALIISQFTLAADTSRGNRPGFSEAAPPDIGEQLYREFVAAMTSYGTVQTGIFGADMRVDLCNDGPVTIYLDI